MKMHPLASLLLLSAVVLCVCGQPPQGHGTAGVGFGRMAFSAASSADAADEELAAGLGGLDGAVVLAVTPIEQRDGGTMLTRNDAPGRRAGN